MGYLLGGLVPLAPYFFVSNIATGLRISVAVMAVALFAFGYAKTCLVRVGSGEEGEDTVQLSMPWNWDWSWIRGGEAGRKVKGRRGRRARAERWRARREAARGGVQMVVVGGLAAGAAMGMVVAFDRLMK